MEARKAVETAAATVRELIASLNRAMGWPNDTELELAVPEPLVENISLQEISAQPHGVGYLAQALAFVPQVPHLITVQHQLRPAADTAPNVPRLRVFVATGK